LTPSFQLQSSRRLGELACVLFTGVVFAIPKRTRRWSAVVLMTGMGGVGGKAYLQHKRFQKEQQNAKRDVDVPTKTKEEFTELLLSTLDTRVVAVWNQIQSYTDVLTQDEVAAGMSLIWYLESGHHSKEVVGKATSGLLNRPIVITENGDLYFLLKKRGQMLGEGVDKRVYVGLRVSGNVVQPIADLSVRHNIDLAVQENELAASVNSPYVMRESLATFAYQGTCTTDGMLFTTKAENWDKLFIAQERMDGDFRLFAQDASKGLEERLDALLQLAKGVRDLHREGIAHRDLYFRNVLYRTNSVGRVEVKVSDLGRATSNASREEYADDLWRLGDITEFVLSPVSSELQSSRIHKETDQLIWDLGWGSFLAPKLSAEEIVNCLEDLLHRLKQSEAY